MKLTDFRACLFLLLITSCRRDKFPDEELTPPCQVSAVFLYEGFSDIPVDSATYIMEGGLPREIKMEKETVRLVYNNNKIVRKDYFERGTPDRIAYDTIFYNSRNEMQEIAHFKFTATSIAFELMYHYEFVYNEGKLIQIFHRSFHNGSLYMLNEHHFSYEGENIIRNDAIRHNSITHKEPFRFDYVYTDSLSPIPAIFKFNLLLLPDFNFNNEFLPMFISKNLMKITYLPVGTRPITYLRDDRNNIIAVENGPYPTSSHPTIGFSYRCPK